MGSSMVFLSSLLSFETFLGVLLCEYFFLILFPVRYFWCPVSVIGRSYNVYRTKITVYKKEFFRKRDFILPLTTPCSCLGQHEKRLEGYPTCLWSLSKFFSIGESILYCVISFAVIPCKQAIFVLRFSSTVYDGLSCVILPSELSLYGQELPIYAILSVPVSFQTRLLRPK